jgi:hypothetical protein
MDSEFLPVQQFSTFQASCKTFRNIRIVYDLFQNDVVSDVFKRLQLMPSSVNLGRQFVCGS